MKTDLNSGQRRVYLISTAFQAEYEVGFANGLVRNGVPVTVIGSDRTLSDRLDAGVDFLNLRGDQSPGRPAYRKAVNILRYFLALGRTARRDPSAVFHTNGMFALRSGLGVLVEAVWCGLNIGEWWLTVHNILPHDQETPFNRLVFGLAYRIPKKLFVHTPASARELCERFGVRPERVHVVEHGIDRFVRPDPDSKARLRQRFTLPDFRVLLLLFGNISRYKGVDLMLEAMNEVELPADTIVLIAGRATSADYSELLRSKMESLRNRHQLVWIDAYLSDADIPDLLAAADCMVLPYRKIDQSGVIFAAKSAGTPILATDVGSFRAYAQPGRDMIVPPADTHALAQGMYRMALRGVVSDRAEQVEQAKRRFAWQVTLQPYAELTRAGRPSAADIGGSMEDRI